MDGRIVEMDDYSDLFTTYVVEALESQNVNFDTSDREQLHSLIVEGADRAREEVGQHWELALRGGVDVMIERMLLIANKIESLSPHPPASALADEEKLMLDRLQVSQQSGVPVTVFSFCPCFPFCK
jgi:hypothetical protein